MTSFSLADRHPSSRLLLVLLLAVALAGSALATALVVGVDPLPAPVDPRLALPPLQAPGEWFDSQRSIDGQAINYAGAVDQAASLRADGIGGEWTNLGPSNIGGRVNDVVTDADDPTIVYAATASGGVWRGTDRGINWERAWPNDLTQAIGSMGRNGDYLLAGSGEANPGGGSIVYGGTGAYVSSDDGQSWESIGLEQSGAIGRIMEHGDGFLIAASGNLFTPGGQRGLYRWAPGMDQPVLLMDAPNDTTGAIDIAVDPDNDDHIMVAMWDHHRTPDARIYSGVGSGVFRTADGGETWTRIPDITVEDPEENGRMAVAFAPSDGNRVYAEVASTANGRHGGFFTSDDGGDTWTFRSNSTLTGTNSSYGWWFGRIYVDPTDADRVYVMGLNLTESTNGGVSFSNANTGLLGLAPGGDRVDPHSDNHSMVFETREPGLIYLGNDGGVYQSTDDGDTWLSSPDQGWTQHYSVDVSDVGAGNAVVTGLQDNGCVISYTAASESEWTTNGLCGDGLESIFMPGNPAVTFSCSQYGGCGRNIAGVPDAGVTFPNARRFGWLADIEFDPNDSLTVYTAGESLYRSTNGGTSWTKFTDDLSSNPEQLDPNPGYQLRGVVTTIAPGHEGDLVWVGTDEGRLWKINASDGGDATLITNADLPDAWITSVTTDPTDDNTAWVTYSGFRGGSDAAHVFVTRDGGATFTDVSANLPNAPVNDIILSGSTLVLANDVGVYVANADNPSWLALGTNLPTVPVIQVDVEVGEVTAATFGHGIQRIPLPTIVPIGSVEGLLGR